MDHVVQLSVDKCISIYEEMSAEIHRIDEDGRIYGTLPGALLIKHGEGSLKKAGFILTDIWKAWCYCGGELAETEKLREPIREPISGMFYAEASAEFMTDGDQYVYLSCYFGPRCARGIRYTLEGQGDMSRFCREEILWAS